ncbi:MAG: SGNH/GDSL hydrolase family protein [Chloroflexi bacterium]|nr:SGNH/GDSL hydrolase family protein [Chloroflexota bacterium]
MTDATVAYLALGDSFTIGTGTSPDVAFPAVLVRLWRDQGRSVVLTNPAMNGYTTDDLIAKELPLAARVRPGLVTLLVGANDIVRGHDEGRYRDQLRSIHAGLRSQGVRAHDVVVLPQPYWSASPSAAGFGDPRALEETIDRFNQIARDEAERAGSRYIDLSPLMRTQAEQRMFAPDGLHPSGEAHAQWATALATTLLTSAP